MCKASHTHQTRPSVYLHPHAHTRPPTHPPTHTPTTQALIGNAKKLIEKVEVSRGKGATIVASAYASADDVPTTDKLPAGFEEAEDALAHAKVNRNKLENDTKIIITS